MAAMLDQLTRCQLLSSRFKFRRALASADHRMPMIPIHPHARSSNASEYPAGCKGFANVVKFLLVRDHVKNDRADVHFREATQLRSDLGITADEVRTIRLKSQKGEKPITVFMKFAFLPGLVKPSFPNGVGIFHRIF